MPRGKSDTPGPSERQPKETAPAFAAFRVYLEQGPGRSTAKVARALGKSKTLIDRWSSRWSWVERVRQFDQMAAGVRDGAHLDELAERSRRQAQIAAVHGEATALVSREVIERAAQAAKAGIRPFKDVDDAPLLALAASMARAHNRAVLSERLALGMTTEQGAEPIPRQQAEEHARHLSDDELDAKLAGVDDLADVRDIETAPSKRKATG